MKIPNFLVWNWIWNILMYNSKVYFTIWSKSWLICDVIVYIGPQLRSFCAEQLNWNWRNLVKCRFSVNRCNAIVNAPVCDLKEMNKIAELEPKGIYLIFKKKIWKKKYFNVNYFVQLNVSLLHCFCVLFNSFAKLYTHFWPFTSTSGGKIILQTLVVVITATSVCKMIFSILQPLVAVITATSVCNYSH